MGMFDYLRCEPDTPDGWKPPDGLFQTKDLQCEMVVHTITADGGLVVERITRSEVVPREDRPYPDAPDDDIRSFVGSIRTFRERREDPEFHGFLHFGALETIGHEPDAHYPSGMRPVYRGHDYRAKFTDGRLVGIEMDPD